MNDIGIVVGEALPKQPLHVLEDERLRSHFSHRAKGLREEISLVIVALVFSTQGERLARRTATNEIRLVLKWPEIVFRNISLDYPPILDVSNSVFMISSQGGTSVGISFDHNLVFEACFGGSEG
jgi:hypothetical protein